MCNLASRTLPALVLLLSVVVLPVHARSFPDAILSYTAISAEAPVPLAAAEAGLSAPEWSNITEQIAAYDQAAAVEATALVLEEQIKVTAPDGNPDDRQGNAVAMACDKLLVGAPGDKTQTGAAYRFERNQDGADQWGLG